MKKITAILVFALALSYAPSLSAKKQKEAPKKELRINYRYWDKQVICHRCFKDFPENTYIGFEEALVKGYKTIECDVAFSKDNVPVLSHDPKVDRCSNGHKGLTTDYTIDELGIMDFGIKKGKQFTGTNIGTLKEILLLARRFNAMVELDCANKDRFPNNRYQTVYDLVKKCGMLGSTIFCDDAENLKTLLDIDPNVIVSISHCKSLEDVQKGLEVARRAQAADFSFRYSVITKDIVNFVHENGYMVKLWTVNKLDDMKKFLFMGVDKFTSDQLGPNCDYRELQQPIEDVD